MRISLAQGIAPSSPRMCSMTGIGNDIMRNHRKDEEERLSGLWKKLQRIWNNHSKGQTVTRHIKSRMSLGRAPHKSLRRFVKLLAKDSKMSVCDTLSKEAYVVEKRLRSRSDASLSGFK